VIPFDGRVAITSADNDLGRTCPRARTRQFSGDIQPAVSERAPSEGRTHIFDSPALKDQTLGHAAVTRTR
jgi:hypothetical protein